MIVIEQNTHTYIYIYCVEQLDPVDGLSHAEKAKSRHLAANIEITDQRFIISE